MTRLERRVRQVLYGLFLLAVLHAWMASSTAAQDRLLAHGASLQIVCAPDRPLVHPGDTVTLRAWVTDTAGHPAMPAVQFAWSASTGTITGGEVAMWSVERAAEGASVMKATAHVSARHEALGQAACELFVYVAKPAVALPRPDRSGRLSARAFLLTDQDEPHGYGLYSYVLFATPPRGEQEQERYLKAIESYLRVLQPIEEMERHRRRSELTITLLPVKRAIELPDTLANPQQVTQTAQHVLAAYDYARAQVLLADLGGNGVRSGPYLVAKIAVDASAKGAPLFFDMSHVVPTLVWDWVQAFCALTAQERSWTAVTLTKLALNTRNVIAVGARATPETVKELKQWIQVVQPR